MSVPFSAGRFVIQFQPIAARCIAVPGKSKGRRRKLESSILSVLLPIVDERRLWAAVLIQAVKDLAGFTFIQKKHERIRVQHHRLDAQLLEGG